MIYVGIDIAKNSHFASAINSDGEVIFNPFSFSNSEDGFNLLLFKIKVFSNENCLIGLEATGHYSDNLVSFLYTKGFKIGIINPIQTDSLRNSNIRKTKNDKIDTFLITQCLILHKYTSPKNISKVKIDTLARLLATASRGRYSFDEAVKLKHIACNSIGIDNPAMCIQVQFLIGQIKLLDEQIDSIDKEIKLIMDELQSPILTIPRYWIQFRLYYY